jgi:hypothetical protein
MLCSSWSVSQSLSVCVSVHLCPCPCPFVSLSLTVVSFSVFLSMSVLCLCPWVNFAMLVFNGLLWQWTTFNAYLLPEKSTDNF